MYMVMALHLHGVDDVVDDDEALFVDPRQIY
jgi:hypothetical protein